MWAYAREQSAKEKMRECYVDRENREDRDAPVEYAAELHERFSEEKMYKSFVDAMGVNEEVLDLDAWFDELDSEVVEHD